MITTLVLMSVFFLTTGITLSVIETRIERRKRREELRSRLRWVRRYF